MVGQDFIEFMVTFTIPMRNLLAHKKVLGRYLVGLWLVNGWLLIINTLDPCLSTVVNAMVSTFLPDLSTALIIILLLWLVLSPNY